MLSTQVPHPVPGVGVRVRLNTVDTSADAPNQTLADLDDLLNWNHWGDHLGALQLCLRFPLVRFFWVVRFRPFAGFGLGREWASVA
jgi:hypothetical protein